MIIEDVVYRCPLDFKNTILKLDPSKIFTSYKETLFELVIINNGSVYFDFEKASLSYFSRSKLIFLISI